MTLEKILPIVRKNNIFITGGAGTGKTYLLNKLINHLRYQEDKRILAVAPTGMASKLLKGSTIHSAFALPFGNKLTDRALNKICNNDKVVQRLKYLHYLIIDEVSMCSYIIFDMMNTILKEIRESEKPFGGVKLIIVGDFFQLPPIIRDNPNPKKLFAFQADAWREANIKSIYLTKIWRAKEGDKLISVLNAIRESKVTEETKNLLEAKQGTLKPNHTILFTHNADVNRINNKRLAELDTKEHTIEARTNLPDWAVEKILKSSLVEKELKLKVGAKVIMIRNNPKEGYVNGSMGYIDSITYQKIFVRIDGTLVAVEQEDFNKNENEDDSKGEFLQFPIKLGWAITIHKSQGMTLNGEVYMDLSKCFEVGQGYVAISRLTSLDNLILGGLNSKALEVSSLIAKVDPYIKKASKEFLKC